MFLDEIKKSEIVYNGKVCPKYQNTTSNNIDRILGENCDYVVFKRKQSTKVS